MYYTKMSMLQFLVYVFLMIVPNSFESPLNMAPIFVILTQANVHSLRLVATQFVLL
jgi:PPE-repeat protein